MADGRRCVRLPNSNRLLSCHLPQRMRKKSQQTARASQCRISAHVASIEGQGAAVASGSEPTKFLKNVCWLRAKYKVGCPLCVICGITCSCSLRSVALGLTPLVFPNEFLLNLARLQFRVPLIHEWHLRLVGAAVRCGFLVWRLTQP
jgi:hypothetical protein